MKSNINFTLLSLVVLIITMSASCKKDPKPAPIIERSQDELLRDSIAYYYKLYSLWAEQPEISGLNIQKFSDNYSDNNNLLTGLKGLTPYFLTYNGGIDRFSFLEDLTTYSDSGVDYGIYISIGATTNDAAYPVVYYVDGGSPAHQAGLRRADVITQIQGLGDTKIPVTCDAEGNCSAVNPQQYQSVVTAVQEALKKPQLQFMAQKEGQQATSYSLLPTSFQLNAIQNSRIFLAAIKPTGYFMLSSFEDVDDFYARREIDQTFQEFEAAGIKELIIDMRYNGGGYVNTAEYIANKIIGKKDNQKLMYSYGINKNLAADPDYSNTFADVIFTKSSTIEVNTLFFLVTKQTASAAELLINIFKPYLKVVIIAEEQSTYGKPVGFFREEVMGKSALWATSFKMINANKETDYWDGIAADRSYVTDYIFRDFGDPSENMLAAALNYTSGNATMAKIMAPQRAGAKKLKIKTVNKIPERGSIKKI